PFFANRSHTPVLLTLSLHDALPISAHVREVQDDGDDLRVVTGVGPGRVDGQRDAVAVHQQRVLGALFRPVHGAGAGVLTAAEGRSEEHTSELQSLTNLVCRLLLETK